MWLITKHGFYSVVADARDGGRVLVRARVKGDLEALLELSGLQAEVVTNPAADYRYRVFLSRADWEKAAAALVRDIDYTNFKAHVDATPGQEFRHGVYFQVWEALRRLTR